MGRAEFSLINLRSQLGRDGEQGRENALKAYPSTYLFGVGRLVVHDEHGWGDGVVCVHNGHNIEAYQLGQSAEKILARLLVVKVGLCDEYLSGCI